MKKLNYKAKLAKVHRFYARSFGQGIAKSLDIGDVQTFVLRPVRLTPMHGFAEDAAAMRSDWEAVGNDLKVAMEQYRTTVGCEEQRIARDS